MIADTEWEQAAATRVFLNRWNELHQSIQQLSLDQLDEQAQPVRFPIEFDSINTLLPNTQEMRSAARMLSLHGQVAVLDGNSTQVRLDVEALLGCSKALHGEPILVSQLVSIAIDSMGVELLKRALEQDVLEERDLMLLLPHVLAKTGIGPEYRVALHGEIAMMLPVFDNPGMAGEEGATRLPARGNDMLHYLEHMESVLAADESGDLGEFMADLQASEANLEKLFDAGPIVAFDSILTGLLAPATAASGQAFVRSTLHRMAAICIGIRLYEKKHARLPTSLAELVDVGVDATQLTAPSNQSFGFSVDAEQNALVWGYDIRTESAVPPVPPTLDPGEPDLDTKRLYRWELPTKQ
ncbi:MAG: hypothetical protein R3C53_23215 [Pirellulaceae bacterium]